MSETTSSIRIIKEEKFIDELPEFLNSDKIQKIHKFHNTIENFQSTALANFSALDEKTVVKGVYEESE